MQTILNASPAYEEVDDWILKNGVSCLFLVCGRNSFSSLGIASYFAKLEERSGIKIVRFSDFAPNPAYESVCAGVSLFRGSGCDAIAAVGGGSCLDVAKCVKLYSGLDPESDLLLQKPIPNDIPFLVLPTTAGTGSEATRFAVIYRDGIKRSITDESIIPDTVLFDPDALNGLPLYQRKSTMLDALCHGVESFWSVNSTEESKQYASSAIRKILENYHGYLENDPSRNEKMLSAAFDAGRAINITKTTAAHAMCYKITSLFGVSHGHAAALCLRKLFPYMILHTGDCIDPRGEEYLKNTLAEIAEAFGFEKSAEGVKDAALAFERLFSELSLSVPEVKEEDIALLVTSVNPDRLMNHPVRLSAEAIGTLYRQIFQKDT